MWKEQYGKDTYRCEGVKGFRKVHHYHNFKILQLLHYKVFMTQNEQLQAQATQSELFFLSFD